MTEIIYGFIIAIWVTLNLIYFRLGLIKEELNEWHNEAFPLNEQTPMDKAIAPNGLPYFSNHYKWLEEDGDES